nr:glycosyltransferase family 2 protein [Thiomicrorhabdus marina]
MVKSEPEVIADLIKQSAKPEDQFETQVFLPAGENRQGEGGLRTKGYFKVGGLIPNETMIAGAVCHPERSEGSNKPLITVVTVVYNGEQFLEETILSVINQTYDNVEYIIIDGGSTDGTLDIIKKYDHAIDYWVSEKDKGIYDAMNKGIDLATGEWINFMNGGDRFHAPTTLKDIFLEKKYEEIVLFGDVLADYGDFKKVFKAKTNLGNLWKGMCFSHQSTFLNTRYHKSNKYNISFKLAADFDVIYNAYVKGCLFKYVGTIISTIEVGGVSYVQREKVLNEYSKVSASHKYSIRALYFYISRIQLRLKSMVKKIIGKKATQLIIKGSS